MQFAFKLSLFLAGLTGGLAAFCIVFDRSLKQIRGEDQFSQELTELFYLGFLKIFTLSLFAALIVLPVATGFIAVQSLFNWLKLSDDLSMFYFGISAWFALAGAYTIFATFRNIKSEQDSYINAMPADAPDLFVLNDELARQFGSKPIKLIHLVPDSRVLINQEINRLDDIYYGGKKYWEIGLAALQFLSVVDLKILMAAEYARLSPNRPKSILFAARLRGRLEKMTANLEQAGFFALFNPVGWLIALANYMIPFITANANELEESLSRDDVIRLYGESAYYQAIARNDIESTVYRDMIEASKARRGFGTPALENIYQHIRTDRRYAALSRLAAENVVKSDKHKSGRRSLMIKRSPEISYLEPLLESPASNILTNRELTERRMMDLINHGQ
jgi:hypothetical protein